MKLFVSFFLGILTTTWALAEESGQLIQDQDIKSLVDTIISLPKLGTTGMILFLVTTLVAVAVWWWWKNYQKKITKRENDARRTADQASNRTENQDISDSWNKASERVEEAREELGSDSEKQPLPRQEE